MKILYLHQHFCIPRGSAGTRSYEFAQRLIARGHEVTMVCGSYAGSGIQLEGKGRRGVRRGLIDGINVIQIDLPYSNYDNFLKRTWLFLRYAGRSSLLALKEDYDLLFATSTPLTAGIPGVVTKLFRRKSFVFEVRDLWPELPKAMGVIRNPIILWAMAVLEKRTYRAADGCIGLSPGIVEGIRAKSRAHQPVAMVPNACDLELFRPAQTECTANASAAHSRNHSEFKAFFSGAHGIANGLHAVLDAAAELKKRGRSDIKLVLIGDGREKPALVLRAETESLDNCVFEDLMPKKQLAQKMNNMNVGLMVLANVPAFYYGTSPNKFFDYIAAGLPVVNNYPGWLADMITEHDCGIAVPPDNPGAFADALERLADDPDKVRTMGKNARVLAEAKFDRESLGAEFVAFLEKVYNRD